MKKRAYYGSQHLKAHKAWTAFSKYIRTKDKVCISCKTGKADTAGHFIPGSVCGKELFFSEFNVNGQCTSCNLWKHSNGAEYAIALQKKYGKKILEQLDRTRKQEYKSGIICRYKPEELKEIEKTYQQKLLDLES